MRLLRKLRCKLFGHSDDHWVVESHVYQGGVHVRSSWNRVCARCDAVVGPVPSEHWH